MMIPLARIETRREYCLELSYKTHPQDELDLAQHSIFILEHILIPLLPCKLIVNKVYECKKCQHTITIRATIASIPINVLRTGLHLEHDLQAFFAPTISDILCKSCNQTTVRHIEVVEWPQVLVVNVNDFQKHIKFRKPPGVLSLAQFSNWLAIACTSSSIYDLTCFNSIIRSGITDVMVRTTKIKKSWSTSMNKKLIGEGEQFRRLFAHCRKYY
jgi:ribosomal protein L37AE/L43A